MPKYRRLSIEELEELEKEFIQFLAVNGIDAQKWQELKKESQAEVDQWLDKFSDVVLGKSLQNIQYVEHKTSTDYKIFFFDKNEAHLFGLKSKSINFLDEEELKKVANHIQSDAVMLFKASKPYSKSREEELFEMMQNGCVVAEHQLFSLLKKLAQ